jgi:hypothetical protein
MLRRRLTSLGMLAAVVATTAGCYVVPAYPRRVYAPPPPPPPPPPAVITRATTMTATTIATAIQAAIRARLVTWDHLLPQAPSGFLRICPVHTRERRLIIVDRQIA